MEKLGPGDPPAIGAYRLLARLGAGGMGQVYLARSDRGRTVAVKLVRRELAEQEEFRARFRQEVGAARRVGGYWTAPVLDADTEATVPWVATGYVAGPSLQQVVGHDHGALPERSVRILAAGLAHALKDIHAAGIVHRDLKPSNVLVTIDGPRVIDFGIARALETVAGDGLTRTGSLVGSPGFMAPEQVRGDRVTSACDVFCLGSVLAYAATGALPFGGTDSGVHAVMFRIAQEEPDLEGVPEGIADLVRECLRKDPAARPSLDRILERTGAEDTVSGGRSRDPWLPSALVAQLGRHAVQLLDTEDPETTPHPPTSPAPHADSIPPRPSAPAPAAAGSIPPHPAASASANAGSIPPHRPAPGSADAGAIPPRPSAPASAAAGSIPPHRPAPGSADAGAIPPRPSAPAPAAAGSIPPHPAASASANAGSIPPYRPAPTSADAGAVPPHPATPAGADAGAIRPRPSAPAAANASSVPSPHSPAAAAAHDSSNPPHSPAAAAVHGGSAPHPPVPAAADGGSAPQGPPALDDESGTGGGGGNQIPAEGRAPEHAPVPAPAPHHTQPPLDHLPTLIASTPPPTPQAPPAPPTYVPPNPYGGYLQQHPQPPAAYGYPQPHNPYGGALGSTPPYGPPPFGTPQEPARRSSRSTALLVVIALVVALGAGGSVYALMKRGGDDKADGTVSPAPTSTTTTAPSDSSPPSTPTPSTTAPTSSAPTDGVVPEGYLGTWVTTIDNANGTNTRQLTIEQGQVGDTVLTLVADGPTDGGGTYHCVFEATLTEQPSSDGPLEIGPSAVTSGEPASSCTPGEATEVTLLPDGRLQRAKASGGESLTYSRQ